MLAKVAAALPFLLFCRKEIMELPKEFDNVEKMVDPTTSDYDIQRLTLEKSEHQSRINDALAVKYAMLFAEQEQK